jgi:hypothetical protein
MVMDGDVKAVFPAWECGLSSEKPPNDRPRTRECEEIERRRKEEGE